MGRCLITALLCNPLYYLFITLQPLTPLVNKSFSGSKKAFPDQKKDTAVNPQYPDIISVRESPPLRQDLPAAHRRALKRFSCSPVGQGGMTVNLVLNIQHSRFQSTFPQGERHQLCPTFSLVHNCFLFIFHNSYYTI